MNSIGKIVNKFLSLFGIRINRIVDGQAIVIVPADRLADQIVRTEVRSRFLVPKENYASLLHEFCCLFMETKGVNIPSNDLREKFLSQLLGTGISEGLFIILCLHETLSIDGDICEFGVAQGATSALIANELIDTNKSLWIFDLLRDYLSQANRMS